MSEPSGYYQSANMGYVVPSHSHNYNIPESKSYNMGLWGGIIWGIITLIIIIIIIVLLFNILDQAKKIRVELEKKPNA